ncbi:MAG TPA: hypothetical protein PLP73_00110 [Candidatus Absconditabacterales bacterium]|nr:hypothetical protein [Candidatus Absconditabacterales bacterium]
MTNTIKKRLEYIRKQIIKENISYGEIVELQRLKNYIDKNDNLLLERAGVEENELVDCIDNGFYS